MVSDMDNMSEFKPGDKVRVTYETTVNEIGFFVGKYVKGATRNYVVELVDDAPRCGAWGGCVLPAGHNMGKADVPEAHDLGQP